MNTLAEIDRLMVPMSLFIIGFFVVALIAVGAEWLWKRWKRRGE